MSAYAYCNECGLALRAPTINDLRWGWECTSGHTNHPRDDVLLDIIADLIDRVEELEKQVSVQLAITTSGEGGTNE